MTTKHLLTVASWEDRFLEGIGALASAATFNRAVMFYYKEYEDWTRENRNKAYNVLTKKGAECEMIEVTFSDLPGTWHLVSEAMKSFATPRGGVVVDFTTMPRELLWITLSLLKGQNVPTSYVYHTPRTYDEWLSRDPGRPRLVYKLSGIATLGQPTCLIVTTGFDPERTRQLMWYYEPRRILLGFQTGEQFENLSKNVQRHRDALKEEYREFEVTEFEINAYADDRGQQILLDTVSAWISSHNVVLTSLGPKLGSIAHFNVQSRFPEVALAYAPSNEFNREYSKGLEEAYTGQCDWSAGTR